MGIILLIIALIIMTVIWIFIKVLYAFFGAPGIVLPILFVALIAAVIHKVGLPIIIMMLVTITAIRKIAVMIDDIKFKKRLRSSFRLYGQWSEPSWYTDRICRDVSSSDYRENDRGESPDVSKKCGTGYGDNTRTSHPAKPRIKRKPTTNNCPNCGGLMVRGVCPYCNTELYWR